MAKTKKSKKRKSRKTLKKMKVCEVNLEEEADGEFILSYKIYKGFDKKDVLGMLKDVVNDLKNAIRSKK